MKVEFLQMFLHRFIALQGKKLVSLRRNIKQPFSLKPDQTRSESADKQDWFPFTKLKMS